MSKIARSAKLLCGCVATQVPDFTVTNALFRWQHSPSGHTSNFKPSCQGWFLRSNQWGWDHKNGKSQPTSIKSKLERNSIKYNVSDIDFIYMNDIFR